MEAAVNKGYVLQIGWLDLKKIIKRIAGGDKRTVEAYRQHLLDFEFLKPYAPSLEAKMKDVRSGKIHVFTINLMMLPYAQTRLDEIIQSRKVIATRK